MDLVRVATAGSVDDGKSTLIGRLLYDSKQILEDTLEAVERSSTQRGYDYVNLALLTDGLRAEREQGITIDVAYRYFATGRRKFILADTPGHVQYTRNMVTGASTADVALILIDARKGLLEQSQRHAFLATLLRVPHVIVCINKMDLVDWDEQVYEAIHQDFRAFATRLEIGDLKFFPVSALHGDNIVTKSDNMPWYRGVPLLVHLEELEVASDRNLVDCRFPVQYVVRPQSDDHHDYRAYAGQVAGGVFRPGDEVVVLPSGMTSTIASIDTHAGPVEEAFPPMSVAIRLERRRRRQPGRHDLPPAQPLLRGPGHRRHGLLDGRPAPHRRRQVLDQAHHPDGAGHRARPALPPRRDDAAPGRVGHRPVAQPDRPGHAAHHRAAHVRRVPP